MYKKVKYVINKRKLTKLQLQRKIKTLIMQNDRARRQQK